MYGLGWLASLNPFNSASTIQEDQVEQTIEEDPEPDPIMQGDTPNTKEMSNLMKAVGKGEKEKVLDIIERTPDILNWTFEKPPLIEAISQMNYEMVKLLIDKKPGLASIMSGDDTPLTFVMKPKFKKKPERMKIFMEVLEHATVNQRIGDSKETALHLSIRRRDSEAFAALVNARDIDFNVQNKEGETPLHLAAHFNQKDYVHALAYSLNCGGRHNIKFELTDKNNTRADQYGQESGNWLKKIIAAKDDPQQLKALDEEYRNSKEANVIEVNLTQIFYNSENIQINNYPRKHPEQRHLNAENQAHQHQRGPNHAMQTQNQQLQRQEHDIETENQHFQRSDQHVQSPEHYIQSQKQHLQRQDQSFQRKDEHLQRQDQHLQRQNQHLQRQDQHLPRLDQHLQSPDHYIQRQSHQFSTQEQSFQRQNHHMNQGKVEINHGLNYSNVHGLPNIAPHSKYPQLSHETSGYSQPGGYQQVSSYPELTGFNGQINVPRYNGIAHSQGQVYSPPPAYAPTAPFPEYHNTRPEKYYQPREAEIRPKQPMQYQVPRSVETVRNQSTQPRESVYHQTTRSRESVSPPGGSLLQKLPTETDSYPPHCDSYQTNANIYSKNTSTYPLTIGRFPPNSSNYPTANHYHPNPYNPQSSPPSRHYSTQLVNHSTIIDPREQQIIPQESSYDPKTDQVMMTSDCAPRNPNEKAIPTNDFSIPNQPQVPYPGYRPRVPNVHRSSTPDHILTTQCQKTTSPTTAGTTSEQILTLPQPVPVAKPNTVLNPNWIHRELLVKRTCSKQRYEMYGYMDQFNTKPNMNRQITV